MDNKLGELLEHPVRLLIQNLHNSNIFREAARQLGNIKKDSNIISGIQTHQKRYGYYWEYASV